MASVARESKFNFKWSRFFTSWYHPFIVYAIILTLFFALRAQNGNNPIFLHLGPFTFRWYGVIITTGVVIAAFLGQFLSQRRGDNPEHTWRILPVLLVFGIVTARIWYVAFTWDSYKDYVFSIGNPTHAGALEIWRGGIAIQGAVVGGSVGTLIYTYLANNVSRFRLPGPLFNWWRWADYVAPGLVLAQGMGRWGNFMNNEAYGEPTTLPWGIQIPCIYRTTGLTPGTNDTRCIADGGTLAPDTLFHPTFLYESLWDYLCFSILFWMVMKPKTFERRFHFKLRDGDIMLTYWIIYSLGRFFTESLRTDSLYLNGSLSGLRSAQVTAIAGIVIASLVMFIRHRKPFPAQESLSVRVAPVIVAGGEAAADSSSETVVAKPDYKARVRPQATAEEPSVPADEDAESGLEAEPSAEAEPEITADELLDNETTVEEASASEPVATGRDEANES